MTALRIGYDKDNKRINLRALEPDRFNYFGFGTFLENVTPDDIDITPEAKKVLLNLPERPRFQGMEFWPDNRLAWASTSPRFAVPIEYINVPDGAKQWIVNL